jgi:hypothetical protein
MKLLYQIGTKAIARGNAKTNRKLAHFQNPIGSVLPLNAAADASKH